MQDELRAFVASGVPTHLLTSVSFDCSKKTRGKDARHNDWYFCSYDETSSSTQSKYVEKTQMFAGVMDWPSFKKTTKDETMRMEPDQLMVLAKTKSEKRAYFDSGKTTVNTVPSSAELLTLMLPPCDSAISCAMASPSPKLLESSWVRALSAR